MAYAAQTLTGTGVFANNETVTIAGKVYTFQTTLTDVDGNVLIGANLAASLANLKAAINLESGAGTTYAASMTVNPHCRAHSADATTLVVRSKLNGTVGNFIPVAESGLNASWGAATLAGGTTVLYDSLRDVVAKNQVPAGAHQAILDQTDPSDLA